MRGNLQATAHYSSHLEGLKLPMQLIAHVPHDLLVQSPVARVGRVFLVCLHASTRRPKKGPNVTWCSDILCISLLAEAAACFEARFALAGLPCILLPLQGWFQSQSFSTRAIGVLILCMPLLAMVVSCDSGSVHAVHPLTSTVLATKS